MSEINSFRDLIVWQKSLDLAVRCHHLTRKFARPDGYALGDQIRKSSVSMPSNIAEGFSRHSTALYIQHLWMAHASGAELEAQIELGRRVGIVTDVEAEALVADAQEIGRMINGLVRSLERPTREAV